MPTSTAKPGNRPVRPPGQPSSPPSTALPRSQGLDAQWLLGTPAIGLDVGGRRVLLADGREVGFDRLLIATGTRARPWPHPEEGGLDGVFTLRDRDDAAR